MNTSVLMFCPTYKNQLTGTTLLTTHMVSNLLRSKGIETGISAISSPDIEWVRNFALSLWYDKLKQYTHLLFIDDDMGFMADVVIDMLLFNEPVVGGLYPKKVYPVEWAVSGLANPETRGPFLEVEGLGCGCFLIRRDAIDQMLEKMPELVDDRRNAVGHAFMQKEGITRLIRAFNCIEDPQHGRVSEDISFCRRWREAGGKVWAATHHKMVHVGPHEYAQTYSEWIKQKIDENQAAHAAVLAAAPILKENPVLRGKACKHGLFVYNPNDTFIGASMQAYGEWCEFEIDLLRKFIKPGDTVIDVGANIGTHTVAFSRMVGDKGRVFAFEAQPRIEKILEANIHLNKLSNVIWDCKAIGDENAPRVVVQLPPDGQTYNFGTHTVWNRQTVGDRPDIDRIDMVTIDSFATELSPSVIKIDVEGMEPDVIFGARETIARCRPIIYVENNDNDGSGPIAAALDEIGYHAYWSIGPYFNPSNQFGNKENVWPLHLVASANLIAFHESVELRNLILDNLLPSNAEPFAGPGDNWRKAIERMAAAHRQAAE